MPVVRVPVQHKFGIVSLSRAEQLLARSNHRRDHKEQARSVSPTSPPSHQLNQAFIIKKLWQATPSISSSVTKRVSMRLKGVAYETSSLCSRGNALLAKYNCATDDERERLDAIILRVLHHAKYKAGLNDKGSSFSSNSFADVDVSCAWLELTLLCQCYGQHQQDVLITLATSMNHAPLSIAHIPSLFYIAGLCYQWLKSDILSSDLLRSGELLLLKILYLVSIRILYHHLTGALMDGCTRDEVRQFKFDLEGFENRERTYRNFPEALLHWKVALEIGLLVCETYSRASLGHSVLSASSTQSDEGAAASTDNPKIEPQIAQHSQDRVLRSGGQSRSVSAATRGHADISLSPILWHALDVWQCSKQGYESLHEAMEDLLNCSTEFDADNWIEGVLAVNILCTASECTLDVLHLVQSLASGSVRRYYLDEDRAGTSHSQQTSNSTRECLTKHSASLTPSENRGKDTAHQFKKGTRFALPATIDSKVQTSHVRTKKSLKTLNVLGMQPDFSESLAGSLGQTLTHSGTGENDTMTGSPSKQSEEDMQDHQQEQSNCSDTLLQSVRTQSLIENESIPETPPSQYSSNTTVLGLDSSATLEATVSMSKSAGLLASSNSYSKNLDLSISNVLSTAILSSNPSPAIGEEPDSSASSIIPVQRKLVSPVSGLLVEYAQPTKHASEELPTLHEVASSQTSHQDARIQDALPNKGYESQYTHYTHSSAPLSGGAGVPGSQAPPSTIYRRSTISTPATELHNIHSTTVLGNTSRFETWPNEVALVYTINMASIVIFGKNSLIQKVALEGFEEERLSEKNRGKAPQHKYGLMQLVEFTGENESETDLTKCGCSSWSIRHGAVLGLSRVCRVCSSLPMKDGLSEVAWSKLMERHTIENDSRVIEAYKISKACPGLDQQLLSAATHSCSSPLFAHIADELSRLFLPPITPAPDTLKLTQKRAKVKIPTKTSTNIHIKNIQPKVETHFESKWKRCDNFTSRTIGALNKIAEEHWKRQMQQEQKEEQLARQKEELKLQKEYEEKMKRKAEKLARRRPKLKLNHSITDTDKTDS